MTLLNRTDSERESNRPGHVMFSFNCSRVSFKECARVCVCACVSGVCVRAHVCVRAEIIMYSKSKKFD